jgi:hypothetical protein
LVQTLSLNACERNLKSLNQSIRLAVNSLHQFCHALEALQHASIIVHHLELDHKTCL